MKELKISTKKLSPECKLTVVKVLAVNKTYKERPYLATPVFNTNTSQMEYGLMPLTAKQMQDGGLVIEKGKNYSITNAYGLKLYQEPGTDAYIVTKDFILYNLLLNDPQVAESQKHVRPGHHVMYLQNFEAEAQEVVSKEKLMMKVGAKVMDCNTDDLIDILFYFGQNPLGLSLSIIEKNVFAIKNTRPDELWNYFEKKDASGRIVFVNKLVAHGLITKDRSGYLMYDNQSLGLGVDGTAAYLYEAKNDLLFTSLSSRLDEKKGK